MNTIDIFIHYQNFLDLTLSCFKVQGRAMYEFQSEMGQLGLTFTQYCLVKDKYIPQLD